MAWQDNNRLEMSISTGDDVVYVPEYMNPRLLTPFNTAEYDFKGLTGSLIKRGQARARRYAVDFYFQGDDNLDVAERFRRSAEDPRPWVVNHPLFGVILAQPIELEYDNRDFNVTRITGVIAETLADGDVRNAISIEDKITEDYAEVQQAFANTYVADVPEPKVSDIQRLQENINNFFADISSQIPSTDDFTTFTNAYNQVDSLINSTVLDVDALINQVQSVLALPAQFTDTVYNRVLLLYDQLAGLFINLTGGSTRSQKKLYENNAGTLTAAICLASVTNYSYSNRGAVMQVLDLVTGAYDVYLGNLDILQSANGGDEGSYIPDPPSLTGLTDLVNSTVSALYAISAKSKQERSVLLAEDSNMVLEAWKYYGLLPDDSTIDLFMESNNIGMNEVLIMKKGRRIVYYV